MADQLTIRPVITGTAEIRRASSDCCSAKLDAAPGGYSCRSCGKPCERVMSAAPEKVALRG